MLFEGELDENFALRKGAGPHQPGHRARDDGRTTDARHTSDKDKVIIGSLLLLSNICAQRQMAEEKNDFINPSSVLFCPFPEAAPDEYILQMTAVHQWLHQTAISQITEAKQKRLGRRH